MSKLWERRVPQVFASYLLGSWAFVQFVDWVVTRYNLAPGWTEVCIIFLLLSLPSVLMFTWYHGKPGKDEWRKIEKIFIPVNIVIAGVMSFLVFPTGSMAAETLSIQVTNEVGDTLTREVPTLQYQQRYAIFPFELEGLSDTWLQHVFSMLLEIKLEQDMRVNAINSISFVDDIEGYGYSGDDAGKVAANIFRTISGDTYCNYYINGTVSKEGEEYAVNFQLYDSKTGKAKTKTLVKGTIYSIVDQMHDHIRRVILLKDFRTNDDEYVDLPAEFLISSNEEALKDYVTGLATISEDANSQHGLQLLNKSIEQDDKCAECLSTYGKYAMAQFGVGFKQQFLEKALPLSKALTERQQLSIKFNYYFPNDMQKSEALCEMWRTLYPMDIKPFQHLMLIKKITKQFDAASQIGEEALEQGHGGKLYLSLAELATARGKFEESRTYLKKFADEYPRKAQTVNEVGMGYAFDGQREKAEEFFKNKIVMDPGRVDNYIQLGTIYLLMGDSEKQWESLQKGLSLSKSSQDSIDLFSAMELNLENQGLIRESFKIREKRRKIQKRILPPIAYAFDDILPNIVGRYAKIGMQEEAKKGGETFVNTFKNDQYNYRCIADVNYYLGIQDGEGLQKSLNACNDFLLAVDGPQTIALAQGVADLENGNYEEAIENLDKFCKISGFPKYQISTYLAEAYLNAGKLEEAEDLVKQALKYSAVVPDYLFDLAKVYKAQGKMSEASDYADQAMVYWKNADPDFVLKKELETFIQELTR